MVSGRVLLSKVLKYPDHELVFMYPNKVSNDVLVHEVEDMEFKYVFGRAMQFIVDEYTVIDGCVYLRYWNRSELVDKLDLGEDEIENLEWKKAIVVFVG